MNIIRSTTELAMHLVRPYITPSSTVIDTTCGNGHDTVALAKAMVEAQPKAMASASSCKGRLIAFDIQQAAIDVTKRVLIEAGFASSEPAQTNRPAITLVCDSHENMDKYVDSADVIVFKLGYFPGGDKTITTTADTTMNAIRKALLLLQKDGVICITMYSGHEAGAAEKDRILAFARDLNSSEFHAIYVNMANQHNNPPEILLITRKVDSIH